MSGTPGAGPLVVVGDLLLDVDVDGSSERLCPDAPVPVIDVGSRRYRPGGAGLAALLARQDGAEVCLVTALGSDADAEILRALLHGIEVVAVPVVGSTVVKTRVRLGRAPVLRLDHGSARAAADPLSERARAVLTGAGAVLVSDYGRGLAAHPGVRQVLTERDRDVPLVWDPHPRGAVPVAGCSVVTPNRTEAERVGSGSGVALAADLRVRWASEAVVVTAGADGAVLARHDAAASRHPVPEALRVPDGRGDPCGAGDRFAAGLTEQLRRGRPLAAAVDAAVRAAARFVADGGAGGVARIRPGGPSRPSDPAGADVTALVEATRRRGGRVVATGGCFDLLHRGHVSLLERARALGDLLVVCLNSDDSVRRAKGHDRPLVRDADRARVLLALRAVDAVVIFDEDTPAPLLERLRPDVWVKGEDYADRPMPEVEVVVRHGGRVCLLPVVAGHSTSRLVAAARPVAASST